MLAMEQISTVRDLIDIWPSRKDLAGDIGASVARVHKWAQAGAIPARFHQLLLDAAVRRGLPVTAEIIVRIHAPREGAAA